MQQTYDFFLAHSSADTEAAETLYDLLSPSAEVFLDTQSLKAGDVWDQVLPEAQQNSLVTVVLISEQTDTAYYAREEIAVALNQARDASSNHRVVPVYLDDTLAQDQLPYGLRLIHGLSVSEVGGFPEVAKRLLDLIGQESPAQDGDDVPIDSASVEQSVSSDENGDPTTLIEMIRKAKRGQVLVYVAVWGFLGFVVSTAILRVYPKGIIGDFDSTSEPLGFIILILFALSMIWAAIWKTMLGQINEKEFWARGAFGVVGGLFLGLMLVGLVAFFFWLFEWQNIQLSLNTWQIIGVIGGELAGLLTYYSAKKEG